MRTEFCIGSRRSTNAGALLGRLVVAATVVQAVVGSPLTHAATTGYALADDAVPLAPSPDDTPVNTIVGTAGGNNSWNTGTNWSLGVTPTGEVDVVISNGVTATVYDNSTPSYTGRLTLSEGSTLSIGGNNSQNVLGSFRGLEAEDILLHPGAGIVLAMKANNTFSPIEFLGDLTLDNSHNDNRQRVRTFSAIRGGTNMLSLRMPGDRGRFTFTGDNAAEGWRGGLRVYDGGLDGVYANDPGSLGSGDVTIENNLSLRIAATNAIGDAAALYLLGNGSTRDVFTGEKLLLDADETIGALWIDGVQFPAATYDSSRSWLSGSGVLTVLAPVDTNAPLVDAILNDVGGGPITYREDPIVNYIVNFDDVIDELTIDTNDFSNAGTAAITLEDFAQLSPTSFAVVARVNSAGTLQLQVTPGAVILDAASNALDTATGVQDDIAITVKQPAPSLVKGQLGLLDVYIGGRINPSTGERWRKGDQYRFVFVSSATRTADTNKLAAYDAFIQDLADASPLGIGDVTWKVIGSTTEANAHDHTGTNPNADGVGEPIYLLDGSTLIARNYAELWDFGIDNPLDMDEAGVPGQNAGQVASGCDAFGVMDPERQLGNTAIASPLVTYGRSTETREYWVRVYRGGTGSQYNFYGISEPLTLQSTFPGTILFVR